MTHSPPILRPPRIPTPESRTPSLDDGTQADDHPAYPQRSRATRPGWKATIVRAESFRRLRAIQKSTTDPAIDLSYLTDACLQLALDLGAEAIVNRALDDLRPLRSAS